MTWLEVESVLKARGALRLLYLAGQSEHYRELAHAIAEGRQPANAIASPSRPAPEADPWLPLIRACPDHNPGCCSHPAAFCSRFTKDVSREQCIECLKADGIGPTNEG